MSKETSTVDPRAAGMDPAALQRLRNAIEGDMARGLHHGAAVLVARRGQIVLHEALGLADRDTKRPARLSDRYWLASSSKSMTAAAVMKLIDRGEVGFDTRVAEVIPEFAVRGKQRVTVYHLLNHTGGTWSSFLPPPPLTWSDSGDMAKMVAAICAQQLTHRPGEVVVYNPWADFTILGEVVQRISGRPFRDFLQDEIFKPLGMANTSFGMPVGHPDRVPVRLTDLSPGAAEQHVMESMDRIDEGMARPAGGAFATASDVFRFAEMLRAGGSGGESDLLSPAIVAYALQNHTGDRPNTFWDFSKEARDVAEFPANFMLMGGYVRGRGHHLTPLGQLASSDAFGAVGAGSTMFMVDPARELTFVFLAAGLLEGLGHFQRLQRLSDLALSAVR